MEAINARDFQQQQQQQSQSIAQQQSKDEVDFIFVANNNNEKISNNKNFLINEQKTQMMKEININHNNNNNKKRKERSGISLFSFGKRSNDKNMDVNSQKSDNKLFKSYIKVNPQKDELKNNHEKNAELQTPKSVRTHKFTKSSSIARLLGNVQKCEKYSENLANDAKSRKFNTYGGRRRAESPFLERLRRYSKDDSSDIVSNDTTTATTNKQQSSYTNVSTKLTLDSRDLFGGSRSELVSIEHFLNKKEELGARTMRSISRSLGKLWWRRSNSVDISTPDPEFKVSYLGNVLTGWAKGEGCVEKQLNTLWRNYTQSTKPDVIMRIKVCASGLKATTRQHGLTEYWANRITHCCAPTNYPRVFCWVYRHEGRKLKHELRCHAVICSKEKIAHDICQTLKDNLECALRDFKREKILKQNARLSLANAAYDNPSLPRRKILLSVGGNNYRPPLERSKSAPKLMAIEEAIGEEEGDEIEETNEPEMRSCCQKDSLYPAMTLGRRRCRRGHSIRRTGKLKPHFAEQLLVKDPPNCAQHCVQHINIENAPEVCNKEPLNNFGSDGSNESFEKLLRHNNYDSTATLSTELLPYFDLQLHKNTSQSLGSLYDIKDDDETEPLSMLPTINSDPNAYPEADFNLNNVETEQSALTGLRREGVCSDGEEDYLHESALDADTDVAYFRRSRQANVLNMLHRESMRKMTQLSLSSDEGTSSLDTNHSQFMLHHQAQSSISSDASTSTRAEETEELKVLPMKQLQADSDEGSISSGCETASIATANQDELTWRFPTISVLQKAFTLPGGLDLDESTISSEEIYQRLESRLETTFSSASSLTLKLCSTEASPTPSLYALDNLVTPKDSINGNSAAVVNKHRRVESVCNAENSDSECSDESGYVEERELKTIGAPQPMQRMTKNQVPPKPLPRRLPSIV